MKDKNAYFTPMQITQIWQKLSCITVALAGPNMEWTKIKYQFFNFACKSDILTDNENLQSMIH